MENAVRSMALVAITAAVTYIAELVSGMVDVGLRSKLKYYILSCCILEFI